MKTIDCYIFHWDKLTPEHRKKLENWLANKERAGIVEKKEFISVEHKQEKE